MAEETTGELGFFETIGRVLWHPRAFFKGSHPFSKVPAVVVWAIAHGLTGLGSAGMFGALPWPDSPRSILYLFGAAAGALTAGAAVSVPFLYLNAGLRHVFARLVGVRSEFAVTRDITGFAAAPYFANFVPLLAVITTPWNWLLTASAMRSQYGIGRLRWIGAAAGIDVAICIVLLQLPGAFFRTEAMPSASMMPTIGLEQKVIVSKLSYLLSSPERGDIIAYEATNENGYRIIQISRVVGLPGDSVGFQEERLVIDDRPVPTCLVDSSQGPPPLRLAASLPLSLFIEKLPGRRHWLGRERERMRKGGDEPQLVGQGEVLVAGDARDQSGARRAAVPLSRIRGKVWFAVDPYGGRLQRINDEPQLSALSPGDALKVSDCFEARESEEERSSEPLALGEAKRSPSPAPPPEPMTPAPEAIPRGPNEVTLHPGESFVVLEPPLPRLEAPEGIKPPSPESLGHYEVFLVDAHRLLRVTDSGATPLGTHHWVAPTAMTRLDDAVFLIDAGHLWRVGLQGELTELGTPWPDDSLLTAFSGALYGYNSGRLVMVSTTDGAVKKLADSPFPQLRALSHFDGPLVVDEQGLVALSPLGELRQRTPATWPGKTLIAPYINGALLLHSNALWRHNVYLNDLDRYGTLTFANARGLAVSGTHVFVAHDTSLVEVTDRGTSVRTVAPLTDFQAIAP